MKINQEIATTMDGFHCRKRNIDGYCVNSSVDELKSVSCFNEKAIKNDIDVDVYLNFENDSDNHDAIDTSDDANDHPQKKIKTNKSIKEAADNKNDDR